MRKLSPLTCVVALGVASGVFLGGCGQPSVPPVAGASAPSTIVPSPASSPAASTAAKAPAAAGPVAGGGPVAAGKPVSKNLAPVDPRKLTAGSIYRNPLYGRDEVVVPDIASTAVLIGDSQSEPKDSWPRQALEAVGYHVQFCGLGGTGFVAANGTTGNYPDALQRGDWKLPYGAPPLVVVEGGGNDAARGATDTQITANAQRLLASLKQRYPDAKMVMIGTLARGAAHGGGRRSEVDALLSTVAEKNAIPFISAGDWLVRYNLTGQLADTVHMNATGKKALAGVLETRIRDLELDITSATSPAPHLNGQLLP